VLLAALSLCSNLAVSHSAKLLNNSEQRIEKEVEGKLVQLPDAVKNISKTT
jgi:hypothetical protein